jgi:hypothetical protein
VNEAAVIERLDKLSKSVEQLQQRVQDLEDSRDLENAIRDNADKPLVPWDQVRSEISAVDSNGTDLVQAFAQSR